MQVDEEFIRRFESLNIALGDLAGLLADEDHGAGYVQRLASESNKLFADFLILCSSEVKKAA